METAPSNVSVHRNCLISTAKRVTGEISNQRRETRVLNRAITLSRIGESSCARRESRLFIVQSRRASSVVIRHRRILPAVFAWRAHRYA
jgi:hypothetical protein